MQVNFLGAVRVTKALLPLLRQAKGRVVNVSSLAGKKMQQNNACLGYTLETRRYDFYPNIGMSCSYG